LAAELVVLTSNFRKIIFITLNIHLVMLTNIGKYLFLLPFLGFGVNHLRSANMMAGMVPTFIPGGSFWVYFTGLGMLAFVASALLGKYDKLGAYLTAAMCVIFALTLHLPAMMGGDQMAIVGFLKDLGLAGGALMFAGTLAKDNSLVG
jgi:putative oxidoreductase